VSDIESLRALYLSETSGEPSRFHIWERGEPVGDSVTPSTYSRAYQTWIRDLLRKFLDDSDTPALLSLGCGNAAVEAGLVADGYRIIAIDAMEEAVTLARAKGIDAVCADFFTWKPPSTDWTVVYADGFLGHAYDPDEGLRPVLERIRSRMPPGRAILVNSNDDPRTDADVQGHTEIPAFSWTSGPCLKAQGETVGFTDIWTTWFTYQRPVSGPRERVIVTARS
jgi:SAM-dependent methyltransferase